jgi:hypothetical protein
MSDASVLAESTWLPGGGTLRVCFSDGGVLDIRKADRFPADDGRSFVSSVLSFCGGEMGLRCSSVRGPQPTRRRARRTRVTESSCAATGRSAVECRPTARCRSRSARALCFIQQTYSAEIRQAGLLLEGSMGHFTLRSRS